MANTKNSDLRLKVLDRCLRTGWHSTAQLMDAVNTTIRPIGIPEVTSPNTIRSDLRYMETYHPQVEIEMRRSGRNISYRYRDPSRSIYKLALTDEELLQLSQSMAMLARVEGLMPQMEWVETFINRFKESLNIAPDATRKMVGFDWNPYLRGLDHFGKLLSAISNRTVIKMTYGSFRNGRHSYTLHPYYLKEYNNRWFLLCRIDRRSDLTTFALDRIENFELCPDLVFKPLDIDLAEEFFADIVGVSRPADGVLHTVELRVSARETPYVHTRPLHESQIMTIHPDGSSTVILKVYLNYELENLLLSHSDGITVVRPECLAESIRRRLTAAIEGYR